MNENIKRLVSLAEKHARNKISETKENRFSDFFNEKFAELIVVECARISNEVDDTMTNQGAASAAAFMEHFGIEND